MIQLGEHFRSDERGLTSEQLQRHRWFIKARQDHQRQEMLDDRQESSFTVFAESVAIATEIQIQEFEARLDAYDEATVKALMENQEALDLVNAQLDAMLEQAYVMEDGRRVFKTADGAQVFDESGREITRDELDFGLIPSGSPTWEQRLQLLGKRDQFTTERKQILEFQEKIDEAREQVAKGKMTVDEMDDFKSDLADAVPPPVKMQMSGFDKAHNAPAAKSAFAANAAPGIAVDMSIKQEPTVAFNPMG